MYTAMYCLGAVAAILSVAFRYKQYSPYCGRAVFTEIIVVIMAVLSGKLLFGAESLLFDQVISFSGIRIYGLIYSVPIMCFVLKKLSKQTWSSALAMCTPGLALSSAFARVGCQYAGCCGGPPILIGNTMIDIPEQLIEGIFDISLFFILLVLEKKGKRMWLYPIYLMSYSIMRFFLEFLRDASVIFMGLTFAQLLSLFSFGVAIIWCFLLYGHNKRNSIKGNCVG